MEGLNGDYVNRNTSTPSNDTADTTAVAFKVITASFAMLFYVVLLILSALGSSFSWWSKQLSKPATYVLFLMGAVFLSVNFFTNKVGSYIEDSFRIASGSLVGIVFVVTGAVAFFQKPPSCTSACRPVANRQCIQHRHENTPTLARQHPSMGLVVGTITLFLTAIEAFCVAGSCEGLQKPKDRKDTVTLNIAFTRESIFLIQKVVQASVYIWLRYRTPSSRFKDSASFYFKILSFFNFVLWLNDIITEDHPSTHSNDKDSAFAKQTMKSIYEALLIDYRLLCSLLFLEHALEIHESPDFNITPARVPGSRPLPGMQITELSGSDQYVTINDMTSSDRHKRNLGYFVGLSCLLVQLVRLSNYVPELHIGPWVHIFATVVYALLSICGMILLKANNLEIRHKSDTESAGVKIMVCCMGAVSATGWIIQATLVDFWVVTNFPGETRDHECDFGWAAANLSVRAVGTLFLATVFAKVNVAVITKRNPTIKVNHFIVPVMMLGILSEFVGTAIDQHAGVTQNRIRHYVTEPSLELLFEAGSAIYLGFCIHLFLYFLIIQCNMGKTRVALNDSEDNQATETSPLLGFLRSRNRNRKSNRTV